VPWRLPEGSVRALARRPKPGQNYLCEGLALFFTHTRAAMQTMATLLQRGRPPSEVMAVTAADDAATRSLQALSLRRAGTSASVRHRRAALASHRNRWHAA